MLLPPLPKTRQSGFTFLETLTVVCVTGVLSSIVLSATASAFERTGNQKLRTDVRTLNSAVRVYLANGGDLSGATDAQDVIKTLKSSLSGHDAARFVGLTSSMIDIRIEAEYQTTAEAITDQLRAEWDPSENEFVLGDAGDRGIKRFYFNEELSGTEFETESRNHSGFMYALEDEWIWDYQERPKLTPTEVTTVGIYFRDQDNHSVSPVTNPLDEVPVEEEPEDPYTEPDPDAALPLNPPLFTPEGGPYEYHSFPMEITLEDTNEPFTAVIRYSINEGSFQTYSAPFVIQGDDTVRAYSASLDTEKYMNSIKVSEFYEALPEVFDGDDKGKFKNGNNGHGNNLDGADVSNPGQAPFEDESGDFDDEKNTAVVSYAEENEVGIFTMGEPWGDSSPNQLKYKGTQFIKVEPEAMFKVGTLEYFNGTVQSGTQADAVTMDLLVSLTTPDRAETLPISLGFDNTSNTSDAWESADSVIIRYRTIPLAQTLNGKSYFLVVEFGAPADPTSGKSSKGQFKVQENSSTSVPVYGYFTTSPPQ